MRHYVRAATSEIPNHPVVLAKDAFDAHLDVLYKDQDDETL